MSPEPSTPSANPFKSALHSQRRQIGLWSGLGSNMVAEILAHAGFDWIVLDTEHAPNEVPSLLTQLQAMTGGSAEPVVRCAWNDPVLIKRILDVGVRSLLVPWVQNAEEARRAVAASRYPPSGIRGIAVATRATRWGKQMDYHHRSNHEMCIIVQIETGAALREIEAIAAVDGVDGIFVGPSDLAADLGHLSNPGHPDVQAAIKDAATRVRAAGKAAGILTADTAAAQRYLDMGFTFVAVGSDSGVLMQGASKLAQTFKS
jgi:4-hydroxy-2-oxoheptanedioate aldolase